MSWLSYLNPFGHLFSTEIFSLGRNAPQEDIKQLKSCVSEKELQQTRKSLSHINLDEILNAKNNLRKVGNIERKVNNVLYTEGSPLNELHSKFVKPIEPEDYE